MQLKKRAWEQESNFHVMIFPDMKSFLYRRVEEKGKWGTGATKFSRNFAPHVARLTLVADPDRLLLEEEGHLPVYANADLI